MGQLGGLSRRGGICLVLLTATCTLAGAGDPAARSKPATAPSAEPTPAMDVNSDAIRRVVLAQLWEPTDEAVEEMKRLLKALVSADDATREAAIQQFLANPAPIMIAIRRRDHIDPGSLFTPEERERLEALGEREDVRHATKDVGERFNFAESQGLMNRIDYLIDLLDWASVEDRDTVAAQLRKLARAEFGTDVAQWKAWRAEHPNWGALNQFAPEVGDLLRLQLRDGRLQLDRRHWQDSAGRIDRKELETRLLAGKRDRRLHAEERRVEYARRVLEGPPERLLFERLRMATESLGCGRREGGGVVRWTFRANGLSGVMSHRSNRTFRLGPRNTPQVTQGALIQFTLVESAHPRRRLEVYEDDAGRLRLLLIDREDGSIVVLDQRENGAIAAGWAGAGGASALRADSFDRLLGMHGRAVREWVLGPLVDAGVALPALPEPSTEPDAPVVAQEPPDGAADWGRGAFEDVASDVGRLVVLAADANGLLVDREHWCEGVPEEDRKRLAETDFDRLGCFKDSEGLLRHYTGERARTMRGAIEVMSLLYLACQNRDGHGGGTGCGSGTHLLDCDFSCSSMYVTLTLRPGTAISLSENKDPSRSIEIKEDGAGALWVIFCGEADGALLVINQGANGRFSLVERSGGELFTATADSYRAFARRYPRYLHERAMASLRQLGVLTPPDLCGPDVMRIVLGNLSSSEVKDAEDFRRLLRQLDSDTYAVREEATQAMILGFSRYAKLLQQAGEDEELSAEVKYRLKLIFAAAGESLRLARFVRNLRLDQDVDYLVDLLANAAPPDRPVVASRLTAITGVDLGTDPDAWRNWLVSQDRL